MPELPKMSLKTIQLQSPEFKATTYTPQQADTSLLANALFKNEERKKEAYTEHSIVSQALGTVKSQLHRDPDTDNFVNKLSQEAEAQINQYVQNGDYSGAIYASKQLASSIANNTELIARSRSNKDYEEKLKSVEERTDISPQTKARWKKQNQYSFIPTLDSNGNVTGGKDWAPTDSKWAASGYMPISDIDWTKTVQSIISVVAPDKTSNTIHTGNEGPSAKGKSNNSKSTLTVIGSSTTKGKSSTKLDYNKLLSVKNKLFSDGNFRAQAEQDFWNQVDTYQTYKSAIDNAKSPEEKEHYQNELLQFSNGKNKILDDSGSLIDLNDYINTHIDTLLKASSYTWKETNNSTDTKTENKEQIAGYRWGAGGSTTSGGGGGNQVPLIVGPSNGPTVIFTPADRTINLGFDAKNNVINNSK